MAYTNNQGHTPTTQSESKMDIRTQQRIEEVEAEAKGRAIRRNTMQLERKDVIETLKDWGMDWIMQIIPQHWEVTAQLELRLEGDDLEYLSIIIHFPNFEEFGQWWKNGYPIKLPPIQVVGPKGFLISKCRRYA